MKESGMCEFYPRIYIGDSDAANNVKLLNREGIQGVLTCGIMYSSWCQCMASRYEPHEDCISEHTSGGVLHHCLELFDSLQADIKPHVDSAMRFVHHCLEMNDTARVLIHCHAGQSRCASFCTAFLMLQSGEGPGPCLASLRDKYPEASPNRTFLKQLHDLDAAQWPQVFRHTVLGSTAAEEDADATTECGKTRYTSIKRTDPLIVLMNKKIAVAEDSGVTERPATGHGFSAYMDTITDATTVNGSTTATAFGNEYFNLVAAFSLQNADTNVCVPVHTTGTDMTSSPNNNTGEDSDLFFGSSFQYSGSMLERRNQAVKDAREAARKRKEDNSNSSTPKTSTSPSCQSVGVSPLASRVTPTEHTAVVNDKDQQPERMDVRCRVCLTRLCSNTDILSHQPNSKQKKQLFHGRCAPSNECSSIFLEYRSWMNIDANGEPKGKIICPNERCGWKLGGYCRFGDRCSCGHWQSPSYRLQIGRVDLPAQNTDMAVASYSTTVQSIPVAPVPTANLVAASR